MKQELIDVDRVIDYAVKNMKARMMFLCKYGALPECDLSDAERFTWFLKRNLQLINELSLKETYLDCESTSKAIEHICDIYVLLTLGYLIKHDIDANGLHVPDDENDEEDESPFRRFVNYDYIDVI